MAGGGNLNALTPTRASQLKRAERAEHGSQSFLIHPTLMWCVCVLIGNWFFSLVSGCVGGDEEARHVASTRSTTGLKFSHSEDGLPGSGCGE